MKRYLDLTYSSSGNPSHTLDLYIPETKRIPALVIAIHGGGFLLGNKKEVDIDFLLRAEFAVASISYRFSDEAIFPAQIEDCKAAVRWLRKNASQYGFDPDRIGALGWSAGGFLAAMLGTAHSPSKFDVGENLDFSSSVQAVVDYFGPTDFLQLDAHIIPGGEIHNRKDSPASLLVGGPIQELPEAVANANPITYISELAPPFLILHGDSDLAVPPHQSVLLHEALDSVGVKNTLIIFEGQGHGFEGDEPNRMAVKFLSETL